MNVPQAGLEDTIDNLPRVPRETVVRYSQPRAPDRTDKKCVWTLNINNYEPAITELTYPFLKIYAQKIGAEFRIITERKYPGWPIVYEKLQLHELGEEYDWNIYIDSDALISPEFFDVTAHLTKDIVCHNGKDFAGQRWRMDKYFLRDARWQSSCNWMTIASNWCLDLWTPLDMTFEEAKKNIYPTLGERLSGQFHDHHLIDDYTLSRNIAKFGLHFTTVVEICASFGLKRPDGMGVNPFAFHLYNISVEEKLKRMIAILASPHNAVIQDPKSTQAQPLPPWGLGWGCMSPQDAAEFCKKWGVK